MLQFKLLAHRHLFLIMRAKLVNSFQLQTVYDLILLYLPVLLHLYSLL